MNQEQRAKLLKLAEHLERGVLAHEQFDFNYINKVALPLFGLNPAVDVCGTIGCALGELPAVFPDEWSFRPDGSKFVVVDSDPSITFDMADEFFGLSGDEGGALFSPGNDRPWTTQVLGGSADRRQVAEGIREFVAWRALNSFK